MNKRVTKLFALLLSALLCFSLMAVSAADLISEENGWELVKSFLKKAESGERNDYAGGVGYEFTCLEDINVYALGRPLNTTMEEDHRIFIWDVETQELVTWATVTPASPVDDLGFKKVNLSEAVTLKKDSTYRIVSEEFLYGDMWYDFGTAPNDYALSPEDVCTINTPAFTPADAQDTYPANQYDPGEANEGYVGVTFYYMVAGEVPAETTAPAEETAAPAESDADTAAETTPSVVSPSTADGFSAIVLTAVLLSVAGVAVIRKKSR